MGLIRMELDGIFEFKHQIAELKKAEGRIALQCCKNAATQLKKDTTRKYKSFFSKSPKRKRYKVYSDNIWDAVLVGKVTKKNREEGQEWAMVHIMGRNAQDKFSGTYRLKFFEKGTAQRFRKRKGAVKKKHYKVVRNQPTGKINPTLLFKRSRDEMEGKLFQVMQKTYDRLMNKAINKIKG